MQDHTDRMGNLADTIEELYGPWYEVLRDKEVQVMGLFDLLDPPLHGPWLPDRRVPIRRIAGRRRREEWDRDYDY